jgi:hypothetical protein
MKLNFNFPVYPDLTIPNGELPANKRAHACWTFYVLAEQQRRKVGNTTEDQFGIYEEFPWSDKRYEQTARSVALMYGLDSPEEFQRYWKHVERQCVALGYPRPSPEYTKPFPRILIT